MATATSPYMSEDKNLFVSGYKQPSIWGAPYANEDSSWARAPSQTSPVGAPVGAPGVAPGPVSGGVPSNSPPLVAQNAQPGQHIQQGHPNMQAHGHPPQLFPLMGPGPGLQRSISSAHIAARTPSGSTMASIPAVPAVGVHSMHSASYSSLAGLRAARSPSASSVASTASAASTLAGPVGNGAVSGPATGLSGSPGSAGGSSLDDELIPTAIVVKNIPFAIKKEQLIDVMTQLGLPLPYAFNYHFDNGVFRGLAFANFSGPEETAAVISSLNGREIGGRKLRVEYKKMLPLHERERIEREKRERRGQLEEQHVGSNFATSPTTAPSTVASAVGSTTASTSPTPSQGSPVAAPVAAPVALGLEDLSLNERPDMNDTEVLEIYTSLVQFRSERSVSELTLPLALPTATLSILASLSADLGLGFTLRDGHAVISRPAVQTETQYPSPLFRGAVTTPAQSVSPISAERWTSGLFAEPVVGSRLPGQP